MMNGSPEVAFGVVRASMLSNVGIPWLLATPVFDEQGLEIVRLSRRYSMLMKKHFSKLTNYVDARQTTSIRWLKWLGFTMEEARPYGVLQLPFHKFHLNCEG